ncbi:MAG: ABC transporter ATP-binding protein [Desulfobacterales bacterium]
MVADPVILKLEKVDFAYPNGRTVLKEADFSLHAGQKIGLIGHNGSGKSTFLHVLVGLLQISGGCIRFFGEPVKTEKDFQKVRRHIGLVFQNSDDQLFSPTVLEDVAFGLLNQGTSGDQAREISRKMLADLDLEAFEDRVTYRLSGGEKRLVSLATVLVMKPRVLLLDEPFTGLDEFTRDHIIDILRQLDISYIIVSHEYDSLERTTDIICSMDQGKIIYNGDSSILHSHFHRHPGGTILHHHNNTDGKPNAD